MSAGGVSPSPLKLRGVEAALVGKTPADIEAVCGTLRDEIDPDTDVHATADYRARVAAKLVTRAVRDAVAEARK